ncbi:MAG TPA: TonB-dependent receptor [Longimicrobium sp.]|nr:TonB-dependent receptor [Longimicrobium sp.]
MLHRRPAATALAAVLTLAAAPPATAQETARDTVPIDTVTAVLRLPVPALRAPYAVSTNGGEAMRRAKPGLALDEALAAIPGVQVENRYSYALGERISVRGFGARAQFGVRGVRVLVDGLPATLPDGQTTLNHVDVGSLERAEVIRGPASALYGNASGGVVRLSTLPPPPVPLAPEYRVTAGSHGLLRMQTQAAGEGGGVAYRASFTRLAYDGFRDHADARNSLLGATLAWGAAGGRARLSFSAVDYDARNPGALSDSLLRADRTAAVARNVTQRTGERGRQGQLGVVWERPVASGALEVTAHFLARGIENPIPVSYIDLDRRVAGLRAALTGARGTFRWSAGGEAEGQRDDRRNHVNEEGRRGALTLDQRERVTALAAFAEGSASLGRFDVLGALRYDRFRFAARDRRVTDTDPDDSGARTMDAWSPTLGLSGAIAREWRVYANVSTAFETPTTTELANRPEGAGGFNPALEPQRTRSLEAGTKGRIGPASVELAAYRARVRDALVPFEVEGAPGRQFFRNAGSALHRGAEASAAVTPFAGTTARLAYTYIDARFGRYLLADSTDLSGNRVPGIAPHRLEGTLFVSDPRGPFAGVDARYSSSIPVQDIDAEGRFRSPAYTRVDARAGWRSLRLGRLRASPSVGVTNLFDVAYNASVVVNAFGGRFYEPGPGRAVHLGLDLGVSAGER